MGPVKNYVILELCCLILLTGAQPSPLANTPNLQPANPERDAITRRFNYFDLELLKEFSDSPVNVFISPASIKTTLALILEGAKGRSADEIGNALRIDINQKEIREILNRLLFDLNDKTANTLLESSNSIFVAQKYNILPEYEKKVTNIYKGAIGNIDFGNPNVASSIINSWVSNATHGLINQIVGNDIDPDTALIIANALFFKGKWQSEFNPNSTKDKFFNSPTRGRVKTPLMQISHSFNYNFNVDLSAHAVELPYQDDKYAMLILLPSNGNNVRTLARDIPYAQFHMIIDALTPTELVLEIPKFEIEYQTDLLKFLTPLKIQEIFSPRANLTGMVTQTGMKVDNIIHKTKIEVNEQGTKAAAVTAAVVIPLMGSTSQRVIADQPFIFFIYHRETRNIIFEGIFVEPSPALSPVKTVEQTNRLYGGGRKIVSEYPRYEAQRSTFRYPS